VTTRAAYAWAIVAVICLLALAGLLAIPANGYTRNQTLDAIASWLAMRPVGVKCYDELEDGSPWSHGAWGYVWKPVGKAKFMHLDDRMCEGALGVNDPELPVWKRALGVLVLTHESYHLRRWGAAANEAKVECKAGRALAHGPRPPLRACQLVRLVHGGAPVLRPGLCRPPAHRRRHLGGSES
jgi:hypothetical protein